MCLKIAINVTLIIANNNYVWQGYTFDFLKPCFLKIEYISLHQQILKNIHYYTKSHGVDSTTLYTVYSKSTYVICCLPYKGILVTVIQTLFCIWSYEVVD